MFIYIKKCHKMDEISCTKSFKLLKNIVKMEYELREIRVNTLEL